MEERKLLFFDIDLFLQGELWRFYTGHFIYYSLIHLIINTVALLIFIFIFNQTVNRYVILDIFALATLISAGLIIFSEQLSWYVGFSGILTGLFTLGSIRLMPIDRISGYLILALITGYTAYQLYLGELIESFIYDIHTSTYAHVLGFLGGILLALFYGIKNKQ